ncbi:MULTISPECIES: TIGR02530 family flagellar biosynthesis protein [Rossellomorea]|jgi:flagellar operon protein|uniref:TIGR02530 family flagellar biosynthesis protein n=1 Tax=Rossellomorea TaxID=2837508 RepID=UPI0011E9854B|nr:MULTISPECIES: TIGR02530 family flagellar biosynthesis protein [Rossellomorea]MDT9023928.1 TIGR02530 family flagellar biosynthesis protein [Rossellomorea sp. YC4-1]TYS91143.1 flagellar protein [Rossellomorea aquimaris]
MEKTFFHRLPQPIAPINKTKAISKPSSASSFAAQLDSAIQHVPHIQISKHAKVRMEQRGISISPQTWEKIGEKMNEAKTKGVGDSLVILKDAALIVSAKNKTVITALDRDEAHSQIFTNINGTILIDS